MGLPTKLAKGAIAGLASAAAMSVFRLAWEGITRHRVRDGIFGFDREADVVSANLVNELVLRKPLPVEAAAKLGLILHYVYGALLGATYAAVRKNEPKVGRGRGIPAGAVIWLAADEVPIALSGISSQADRSFASHGAALAAHLLYAATLESTLRRW